MYQYFLGCFWLGSGTHSTSLVAFFFSCCISILCPPNRNLPGSWSGSSILGLCKALFSIRHSSHNWVLMCSSILCLLLQAWHESFMVVYGNASLVLIVSVMVSVAAAACVYLLPAARSVSSSSEFSSRDFWLRCDWVFINIKCQECFSVIVYIYEFMFYLNNFCNKE